jgi:hypothetical protein
MTVCSQGWEEGDQDPCNCHETQTDITNAWNTEPGVAATARKGRAVVGFLHSSTIGRHDLHACSKMVGLEEALPPQDVATRWRSEWGMADGMREQQDAILLYDVRYSGAKGSAKAKSFQENKFTLEDWQINNQGAACLYGLAHASKLLEGKNYPTSNMVLYTMYTNIGALQPTSPIRQHWDGQLIPLEDIHPSIKKARAALLADLDFRWISMIDPEREQFYLICTLCDPRLKDMKFYGVKDDLRELALRCLTTVYDSFYAPSEAAAAQPVAPPLAPKPFVPGDVGSFSSFQKHMQHLTPAPAPASEATAAALKHEVSAYMAAPVEAMHTDVLTWWAKVGRNAYPNLAKLARQYLGCPASSASAERIFSLAGRVFGDHNQAMNPETLEERMWAKANRGKLDCLN